MRKRRLMIKFIIGLVAVVLLALGAYMFTHSLERVEQKVSQKREHALPKSHEVAEPKVSQPKTEAHLSQKAKEKDVLDEVITSQSSIESSNSAKSSEEIGKGLTLEEIENADVSEEEKERMRDDMVYYQGVHMDPQPTLSEEEVQKMIEEDLEKGLI